MADIAPPPSDDMPLIEVKGLTKHYRLYARPRDRLADLLWPFGSPRYSDVAALESIDFKVWPGECLGLIGANGSGKSTLLKLITGTLASSSGTISRRGTVLAMLELGSGLNPDLTGRENIHAMAAMHGLPPGYAASREKDIVAFCDIGDFIDRPVRKYSTGMGLRLGFSIFSFLEPDILIIDEALAVGDVDFQLKCYRRVEEMISDKRRAVIIVSHDLNAINRFCDRAIWLERGFVRGDGEPAEVTQAYVMASTKNAVAAPKETALLASSLAVSRAAVVYHSELCAIEKVWIENAEGQGIAAARQGEAFHICYRVHFKATMEDPLYGMRLVNRRGDVVVSSNTLLEGLPSHPQHTGDSLDVRWPLPPSLLPGDYFISCGVSRRGAPHDFAARMIDAFAMRIQGDSAAAGYVLLAAPPRIGSNS
jgi:ABC-type polysaccharide/polyol phosphate transport system ATPase subunit